MKKTEISQLTIEDLNKKNESLKIKAGMLVGILIVLLGAGVYATMLDFKFLPIPIVGVALLPLVIVSFVHVKQIKTEIARRNK